MYVSACDAFPPVFRPDSISKDFISMLRSILLLKARLQGFQYRDMTEDEYCLQRFSRKSDGSSS